ERIGHTVAVLLPGSAFFVGYAPPDARRFLAARVPVAIATDHNPGTSPLEGMPAAIALAVTLCHLTPHEAIVAATLNAAHALGLVFLVPFGRGADRARAARAAARTGASLTALAVNGLAPDLTTIAAGMTLVVGLFATWQAYRRP